MADANDVVKRLLKVYNVKVKHYTNMKNLAKCNDDTLHAAAAFLGGTPHDDSGEPRYRTRDSLIDWIIMGIEGLFPQDCSACKSQYTLERGDSPKFRCVSCGGGSHDCEQILKQSLLTIPGFVCVCEGCIRKFNLETLTGPGDADTPPMSATSHRKFSYPTLTDETSEEKKKEEETKCEDEYEDDDDDDDDDEEDDDDEDEDKKKKEKKKEKKADNKKEPTVKLEEVCPFYLQRRCGHARSGRKKVNGSTCSKKHAQLCYRYSDYGTDRKNSQRFTTTPFGIPADTEPA
jgi:hypothetical protein